MHGKAKKRIRIIGFSFLLNKGNAKYFSWWKVCVWEKGREMEETTREERSLKSFITKNQNFLSVLSLCFVLFLISVTWLVAGFSVLQKLILSHSSWCYFFKKQKDIHRSLFKVRYKQTITFGLEDIYFKKRILFLILSLNRFQPSFLLHLLDYAFLLCILNRRRVQTWYVQRPLRIQRIYFCTVWGMPIYCSVPFILWFKLHYFN